jgi:hypothetical protein
MVEPTSAARYTVDMSFLSSSWYSDWMGGYVAAA